MALSKYAVWDQPVGGDDEQSCFAIMRDLTVVCLLFDGGALWPAIVWL